MAKKKKSCLDCVHLTIDEWGAYCSKTNPVCMERDQFKKRNPY